jgi:hypothetical protein
MTKLLWPIVPACLTFGPLFMTRIAGSASPEIGSGLVLAGVFMLAGGLAILFAVVRGQQKAIEELQAKLRRTS